MRHRLPCLVRAACPSASSSPASPHPPSTSRSASTATARAAAPARARYTQSCTTESVDPTQSASQLTRASLGAAGERSDNFPGGDAKASAARTLVERLQLRRSLSPESKFSPAEFRGEPAGGPVTGSGPAAAAGELRRSGVSADTGGERAAGKGKSRRRPANAVSQLDFASFPRPKPSASSSAQPPSADSLLSQPLPASEPALYNFLRLAHTTHPNVPPSWLAWFHAHPRIAPHASTRTYRLLLHRANLATDKALVRELLSEMQERGIALNEETRRVLLRGYLRGGEDAQALEVARGLSRAGRGAIMKATKPRDLGEKAKGHGDTQLPWKGWATRGRDKRAEEARRAALDALLSQQASKSPQGTYRRRKQRTLFSMATTGAPELSGSPNRPPTLVPARPATLSSSDVSTLVEYLVQERRFDEAHAVTDAWLVANRPQSPTARRGPPCWADFAHPTAAHYQSTALVLMNILLKSLFFERPSLSSVRAFVDAFIAKHSAPFPAFPLTPNVVTLRLLVSGCLDAEDAWDRATSLVDWYGYGFGLPPSDGNPGGRRRYFVPPSQVEGLRVGVTQPSLGVAAAVEAARDPVLVPPHAVVPPDVAVLLLRHAVDQYERGTLGYGQRIEDVRRWWNGFDRGASDVWGFWKTRQLVKRAQAVGLLANTTSRPLQGRERQESRATGAGDGS